MNVLTRLNLEKHNSGAWSGYRWHSELRQDSFLSVNPSTEETLAAVSNATLEDYETVLRLAQKAWAQWRMVPAPKRGEIIRQIGARLRECKEELGTLIALEVGKSKQEGEGEVQEMIDMADLAVGQSRMLYGKTMQSERPFHRMYEQWHPLGLVGIISAFNFPMAVWAWNAFLAAICGNVIIWKPSTKTPLCALAVQHLCNDVLKKNNCPEIFNVLISEHHDVVNALVNDGRISLISFTGSTPVGRRVATQVAARLGKIILELGGNNAVIVDKSADLQLAIPAIVFGAIGTAGQRCTSTRRVFIHESLYEVVLERLQKAYLQVSVGNPLNADCLMGPLIDKNAVLQFKKTTQCIQKAGGKIVWGGRVIERSGFFVEPTLVTEVQNDWPIVQQETFAPILYLMPFSHFEDALALQNGVLQGLSSSLFSQNLNHCEHFLSVKGSDCGLANINIGTSGAEIGGAFGGEKETGGGREAGSDAWKAYMRRQTNTINWGTALPLAQGIEFNLSGEKK